MGGGCQSHAAAIRDSQPDKQTLHASQQRLAEGLKDPADGEDGGAAMGEYRWMNPALTAALIIALPKSSWMIIHRTLGGWSVCHL